METIEIARRLAQLGKKEEAIKAFELVLHEHSGKNPLLELEAANYIFFEKGDYRVAYTTFVSLYNRGQFQGELMELMRQAFYEPNLAEQRNRYRTNCTRLGKYPYLFRKDFPEFDQLPIEFFPFDDNGYIPYYKAENRFGEYVNLNHPVIDRYFFKDLENPVLADDVYSQYQLEYLNDTVRESMWVGKENHIYLHYTQWETFCAYLNCLDFRKLLENKKFVFLMEDEVSQYPIDFKERFGIDYSQYPVKPLGIREINRLIWHTQLSTHNGGDFFNEIFYGHPNLLTYESIILDRITDLVKDIQYKYEHLDKINNSIQAQMAQVKHPTAKDFLVATFLNSSAMNQGLDRGSRIVPALLFQPHFHNMVYSLKIDKKTGATMLYSEQYEQIAKSPLFKQFKYIKTFTPMRRLTTSYAATVRFMAKQLDDADKNAVIPDAIATYLLNRSFMIDWQDRLFKDSVLVRFEDGKLNPKATFTALAEFLDIPYTESMTYCSSSKGINPESMEGNVRGFDPATVYRTYDDFANDDERAFLEYFFRDVYQEYGYDFHYYKGESVTEEWILDKLDKFTCMDSFIAKSWRKHLASLSVKDTKEGKEVNLTEEAIEEAVQKTLDTCKKNRLQIAQLLSKDLRFINKNYQPLRMMKKLQLDPNLLEQPLYH